MGVVPDASTFARLTCSSSVLPRRPRDPIVGGLKLLKQWIDRGAIALATKALAAARTEIDQDESVVELLNDAELLTPPRVLADLTFVEKGTFRFKSSVTSRYARNNIVHGRFHPSCANPVRNPTVILVHGWNAELHYLYGFPKLARC